MFLNLFFTIMLSHFSLYNIGLINAVNLKYSTPLNKLMVNYPNWFIDKGFEGKADWNYITKKLTFKRNISFATGNSDFYRDKDKEGFYFSVLNEVHQIVINNNVTVTGGFRIDFSKVKHDVVITGLSTRKNNAKLFGTSTIGWVRGSDKVEGTTDDISDNEKWKYGLVSVYGTGNKVILKHLTFENSRAYNVTSFSAPIEIDDCYFLDSRQADGVNCDGVSAGAGSKITNSTFNVTDDAIKLYRDITVENVTIYLQRNGAPFQLGWGNEGNNTANLKNILIEGIDSQCRYNLGVFSWVSNKANTTRNLIIDGLRLVNLENAQRWGGNSWIDFPFFMVNSPNAKINFIAQNVDIRTKTYALPFVGNHQINICNNILPSNVLLCGFGSTITGNKQ